MFRFIESLSKVIDLSRHESWKLTLAQILAVANRDFAKARQLDVSIEDYLRVIGCRNI